MSELNITGLSPLINTLESGKLYCITAQSSRWFDLLISHVTGERNTLLSIRNIKEEYPNVFDNYISQQIDIITIAQKHLQKLSKKIDRLIIELTHLNISNGALYIDMSDLLLSNKQNNQRFITQLKTFAENKNVPIVLLFSQGEKDSKVETFLSEQRTDYYGLMRFTGEIEPNKIQIDIWYTDTGCVVNQSYRVQNVNGHLALSRSDNTDLAISKFEQSDVIVDEHHKQLGSKLNHSWTLANSEVELFDLVRESPTTTVLIHALNTISLKELAQRIYKLRQLAGKNLKVIVLEVNLNLRMTEQNILRCLGANLILPGKIQLNTLINIISSTDNLVFVGDLTADFYDIFDEDIMPVKLGYMTPQLFSDELKRLSGSGNKYGIASALIILQIPSGIAAMDTIKYAQFNRHGDIFTIVDTSIFVYLYGCRQEDINTTLTYILGTDPLLIFSSEKRYTKPDAITIQNMHLDDYIKNSPTVNFQDRIDEFAEHRVKMENMRSDKMDYFEINVAVPTQLKLK